MISFSYREIILTRNYKKANRKPEDIQRIAIHWTANESETADADNNAMYFNTTNRQASAHDIIDKDGLVHCVDYKDIAFAVGKKGNKWNNKYSISEEMCANFTNEKDSIAIFKNSIKHFQNLHKWFPNAIFVRHYDFTGKKCPKWFVANEYQTQKEADIKFINFLKEVSPEVAEKSADLLGIPYYKTYDNF